MNHSSYNEAYLTRLAMRLMEAQGTSEAVWCIFDNTARDAAAANSVSLLGLLASERPEP